MIVVLFPICKGHIEGMFRGSQVPCVNMPMLSVG